MKRFMVLLVSSLILTVGCSKLSSVSMTEQEQMQLVVATLVSKVPMKAMTKLDQCAVSLTKYDNVSKEGDVLSATVSYQPSHLKMLSMLGKTFFPTKDSEGCDSFKKDIAKHGGDSEEYVSFKVSVNVKTGERVSFTAPSRETSSTK